MDNLLRNEVTGYYLVHDGQELLELEPFHQEVELYTSFLGQGMERV